MKLLINVFLGFTIMVAAGCSDEKTVVGSCQIGELSDKSVLCINYDDAGKLPQWRMACESVMKGEWSAKACDTSTSLGGCKAGNKVIWYFPSEKHQSVDDAKQSCISKNRIFVPAPAGNQ